MPGREIERSRYRVPRVQFHNLEAFLLTDSLPNDSVLLTVNVNGLPIDILVYAHPESRSGLVMFHGAIDSKFTLPVFQGGGVTAGIPTNRIFISDPTLAITGDPSIDGGLTLGWHAGNYRQPDLQDTLTRIIRKLFELLSVQLPVFHGISGGGFAALYYAAQFRGSIAIPTNPQTNIKHYLDWAVLRWANIGFGISPNSSNPLAVMPSTVTTNVISLYSEPIDVKVLYMQNSDDHLHIERHLTPFSHAKLPSNDSWLLLDYWGPRHAQAPKELFAQVLTAAVDGAKDTDLESLGFTRF